MSRILIVEDELILALTVEAVLRDGGHTVVGPAARVDDALRLIDGETIDAALLDVRLRHGEVVYPVADALIARRIRFVFMTAYSPEGLDTRYADIAVLRKPFTDREVHHALRGMLLPAH